MTLTGQTIRGYEIGDRIGSGGYGEVYRATQLSVNRDVAVKVILPQYANDPKFVAEFEAEAKLVAQLEHTNIVPLHDYWQDEHGAFLVMRYVRGGTVKDMIDKQGALPLTRTVFLIEQIADALQTAHDANVIHRDLKPANILIDQRGNAYLTDFGIAKQLTGQPDSVESGTAKGTFAYMSPEQIQDGMISPQTDIYALGIMLYEMLAGQHPFYEIPIGTLLIKHMQEPLPDIRDIRNDLPPGINDVIQKATAKASSDRYTSALDLVEGLKAVLSNAPSIISQARTTKKKPVTAEARNRDAMLTNVRKFWVEGVLENSLHNAAMVELGLKSEADAVNNPWDTLIQTPSGTKSLTDERILEVFDRLNGKLLILGDPGSGKTITLLTLTRDLLIRAELDIHHPLPVIFNLSSWAERHLPLTEWLVEELTTKYQVPRKVGTKWVEDDELLLLLDGLDEVSLEWRDACVEAINTYRSEHGFVDVVVCSRIADYEMLESQLRLNGAVVIQPLDNTQIVEYLNALGADVAVVRELVGRDKQLRDLAQSPLMLSIMVLAYRGKIVDDVPDFDDMEAHRQNLFEVYIARAFERRAVHSGYAQEITVHSLSWIAKKMQEDAVSVFYIEGLQPKWLAATAQRHYVIVVTVMFFLVSACFMALVLATVVPVMISQAARYGIAYDVSIMTTFLFVLGASVLFGGITGLTNYLDARSLNIQPVEKVNWSLAAMLGNGPQSLLVGLSIGTALSLIIGGFFSLVFAPNLGFAMGLSMFVATIFYYLIAGGYVTSLVETKVKPNQGMRYSIRHSLLTALAMPLAYCSMLFLVLTLTFDFVFGASISLITFVPLFLLATFVGEPANPGNAVVGKHVVLRWMLEQRGAIPRNMTAFLDYAASLIMLRKVGGGYIFPHRYLLEYFAGLEHERKS